MTPQLERQLIEMGVLPATMLQSLEVMSNTPISPDMIDKHYFNDPHNENGEVPF